jgi:Glucose-6-phosphate dehydrogenase, NAD binding domain
MSSDPHAHATTGLAQEKRPPACVLTIFGASGDLTKRKLIPALYNLASERRLPERFAVVGCARSEMTHEAFRDKMREAVSQFSRTGLKDGSVWQQFAANLYYVPADYNHVNGYTQPKEFITEFDNGSGNNGCENRGMETGGIEKVFLQLSVRRPEITAQRFTVQPSEMREELQRVY